MSWEIVKLCDCCQSIADGDHQAPPKAESGVPFVTISNIDHFNRFDFSDTMFVPQMYYDKLDKRRKAVKGDVLLSVVGSFGIPVLIKDDTPFVFQRHIAILRPNPNIIMPEFLYYTMLSKSFYAQADAYAVGAAQRTISLTSLRKMKIAIPPLEAQNDIVAILSQYDSAIENNNKRIKMLEQMAESLYKEWFVRRKGCGWNLVKMKDFGYSLESGSRPKGGIDASLIDGIPSLGAEAIGKLGEFDYSRIKYVPAEFYKKMKRGHVCDNDILLYKDGAYIGKVTLFMDEFPFKEYSINEHVFIVRSNNPIYQYYLYFTLKLPQYFTQMQNLNRNAAQPGLTGKDIDLLKLYLPDEVTIAKFNAAVEPMLHKIFILAKSNQNLTKQRDMLLPRLMSGKLEV